MVATLSTTAKNANVVLSGGDLVATGSGVGGTNFTGRGDAATAIGSGASIYLEVLVGGGAGVGFCTSAETFNDGDYLGHGLESLGWYGNGDLYYNASPSVGAAPTYTSGDRLMMLIQGGGSGKYWLGVNGTWQGDPSAGTGGHAQGFATVFPAYNVTNTESAAFNFGATALAYTKPTGSTTFDSPPAGIDVVPGSTEFRGSVATVDVVGTIDVVPGLSEFIGSVALVPAGASIGLAAGVSAGAGVGRKLAATVGAAAATSSAAATGARRVTGIGTAAAVSTASGAGRSVASTGAGVALGASGAIGVGRALRIGVGTAVGVGTAQGTQDAATIAIGTAYGFSEAAAIGEQFQLPAPIQYPFAVPREFCPRSLTIASRNTSMTNESPTTGQQLVGETSFERWEWDVELPVMEPDQGEPVAAFLESLRGMRGAFEFGNPKKRRARGSARQGDNPIVEGSPLRQIYINATSILGNRKRWLAAGDMISIGPPGSIGRRLFRVLGDVDLAFGHGIADVWPAVRVPLIAGDTVYVENPSAIFRLRNSSVEFEIDVDGWYHFPRFSIVQWIYAIAETPDNVRITTGQAQGESNVTGVGRMTVRGTGIALGGSTALGIQTGTIAGGVAAGTSTASGTGRKLARGAGVAVGTSVAQGAGVGGGIIVTGIGAAVATSTALGVAGGTAGGNIVANGTLLTLSIDGVSYGP